MTQRIPWGRVLAEGAIIVVSILVAFGIESWWSERQERSLESALLQQLESDLTRAEAQLADEIEQSEGSAQAALHLLRASRGEFEPIGDSVAVWIRRMSWYSDPVPTIATAQSIASSGDLHIVQNDALRGAIVGLIDEIRQLDIRVLPYERSLDQRMRALNGLLDPSTWSGDVYVGVLDGEFEAYVQDSTDEGATGLAESVRLDGFGLIARDMFWVHENLRWLQARMLDATRRVKEHVRAELDR